MIPPEIMEGLERIVEDLSIENGFQSALVAMDYDDGHLEITFRGGRSYRVDPTTGTDQEGAPLIDLRVTEVAPNPLPAEDFEP